MQHEADMSATAGRQCPATNEYALWRRQENGASRRGIPHTDAARQKMRDAALRRGQCPHLPAPERLVWQAVQAHRKGQTQRQAAKTAGISLGALQRALRRFDA
jgi:hypothetical protein